MAAINLIGDRPIVGSGLHGGGEDDKQKGPTLLFPHTVGMVIEGCPTVTL
jgi:hypothetical protein